MKMPVPGRGEPGDVEQGGLGERLQRHRRHPDHLEVQAGDRLFPGEAVEEFRDGGLSPEDDECGEQNERQPGEQDASRGES